MTERIFALDRLLSEIVQSPKLSSFTITELRLRYMQRIPDKFSPSPHKVQRYLYKQVGRLVRLGWVRKDGKPMSRDVQYRVLELPKGITLNLTEPLYEQESQSETDSNKICTDPNSSPAPSASSHHDIEAKLKSVRMDLLSTLGEAETYKSILADHPCLREKLEALYHRSRDQSLNLIGQLRALEHTVKILEEQL